MKKLCLILVSILFIFNISFVNQILGLAKFTDGDTIKIKKIYFKQTS